MTEVGVLVFSNADAKPHNTVIRCDKESVPHIMAWYGAYCAGDRYVVTYNGRNIPMDLNGEPVCSELTTSPK